MHTLDGGYIVAGSTGSYGTGGDIYLLKLDENGERIWSAYYGGTGAESASSVEQLPTGEYVVAGLSSSDGNTGYDGYLIKVDAAGGLIWEKHYGTPEWDFLHDLEVDGTGYYLVGTTYGSTAGDSDIWLIRTDLEGEVIWERVVGGIGGDEGRGLVAAEDGGCVLAATKGTPDGGSDAYLLKYSNAGVLEWDTVVGTDSADIAFSVTRTSDGGYVLGGSTRGFSQYSEMMLVKVNENGEPQWFSHTGQIADWEGREVRERGNGGLAMVGYTKAFGLGGRDVYLLVTNSMGDFEFGTTYGGGDDDEGWALDLTTDGGFVCAGSSKSFGPGSCAMFVIKSSEDGLTASETVVEYLDPVVIPDNARPGTNVLFPNPAAPAAMIQLRTMSTGPLQLAIRDAQGRKVLDTSAVGPTSSIQLPQMSPGVYQVIVASAAGSSSTLLLVQ